MSAGQFREDLFFRLDVFPVAIPPLRDRASDIPLLAAHILERTSAELNKPVPELSAASRELLMTYRWPGNVRELENCLERALILSDGLVIEPRHLNLPVGRLVPKPASPGDPWDQIDLSGSLDEATRRVTLEVERRKIAKALRAANGDALKAADQLQMAPRLLIKKIRTLGLMQTSRAI
jgi:Nif-specific regulatory protein